MLRFYVGDKQREGKSEQENLGNHSNQMSSRSLFVLGIENFSVVTLRRIHNMNINRLESSRGTCIKAVAMVMGNVESSSERKLFLNWSWKKGN